MEFTASWRAGKNGPRDITIVAVDKGTTIEMRMDFDELATLHELCGEIMEDRAGKGEERKSP
jgi:hypothetical protein